MTAPKNDGTTRSAFDRADPNVLADLARVVAIGSLLQGQIMQVRRKQNPAASASQLATLEAIALPASGKAAKVLRATVRAGGVTGELAAVAYGATPITGEIAVAPNGDLVVLAADAITDMDVVYAPERCDVVESVFPVVSNVLTIPASIVAKGVVLLAEVEALVATSTGVKKVLVPGGSPAAGQAALTSVAKASVTFAAADAVTRARVKLAIVAAEDLATILESVDTI